MKRRRLLSLTLALLLVVSLLPVSVLAADNSTDGATITEAIDTNTGNNVNVAESGSVKTNEGTIVNNAGNVGTNTDAGVSEEMPVSIAGNMGTVDVNNGTIGTNGAEFEIQGDQMKMVHLNTNATVAENNGTINANHGIVTTNKENGEILSNYGEIKDNQSDGNPVPEGTPTAGVYSNFGVISSNSGTIYFNSNVQMRKYTCDDDRLYLVLDENNQYVPAVVDNNSGTVIRNNGTVTNIEDGRVINNSATVNNGYGGTVEYNTNYVDNASGAVVEYNDGGFVDNAEGALVINNFDGLVLNAEGGSVTYNSYEVENAKGASVLYNEGVVFNAEGGILHDVTFKETPEWTYDWETGKHTYNYADCLLETKEITDEGTYVGTFIDQGKTEDGKQLESSGVASVLKQVIWNATLNLKDVGKMFQKDGYEVVGYTDWYETNAVYETEYTASSVNYLRLIWSKIKSAVVPSAVAPSADSPSSGSDEPEATPVKVAAAPVKVAAEDVKVGTIVQRKGMRFQVIEMDDGSILIATVGKLSQKDIEDMKAFLAKYFTAEQLEMLLGDPELLTDELVAKYFGGSLEHICFRAAKDIFAQ